MKSPLLFSLAWPWDPRRQPSHCSASSLLNSSGVTPDAMVGSIPSLCRSAAFRGRSQQQLQIANWSRGNCSGEEKINKLFVFVVKENLEGNGVVEGEGERKSVGRGIGKGIAAVR